MQDPFAAPLPAVTDGDLRRIGKLFGLWGAPRHLGGERDLNVGMDGPDGPCAMKVANLAEPTTSLDLQVAALDHLGAVDPGLPVPRVRLSNNGHAVEEVTVDGGVHAVRVVSFLAGSVAAVPPSPAFRRATGEMLGRLQVGLSGFFHPAAGRGLLWDARQADRALVWRDALLGTGAQQVVEDVIGRFLSLVHPRLAGLPAQVIHNDFHAGNLLTDSDGRQIVGVIDFGDVIHAPRVQDVAVAIAYGIQGSTHPLRAAVDILGAYLDHVPLGPDEVDVLADLISVRFAQSLLINAHRAQAHPENADYLLADTPGMLDGLSRWTALDRREVARAFSDRAGHPRSAGPTRQLLGRRGQVMSPMLATSYDTPLHLIRGEGVWLVDVDGRRYLDAYNNVVQVGHANRRVVRAISGQAATLNTNTRYLTDGVVAYAGRLRDLLPGDLAVCFFVNSGTEANDLAWRIATAVTGNTGVVITDFAYHGWTEAVMAMSPEEHGRADLAPWVATVPPPGEEVDIESATALALTRLTSGGHRPAAALIDSAFSSDGIHDVIPGYLTGLAAGVRASGGLFIADEVQAGMGRVGQRFWGFAGDAVVPDIVTLGKPIGNGFPMGAVITTPDIAAAFARTDYFFSTFGGNPVAAAAGLAVADITVEDCLAEQADLVGGVLRSGVAGILARHGRPGVLRGSGLFVGVDLGDAPLAGLVVEGMKGQGVLISRTGPGMDVLKIRPPLVFDEGHAGVLLEALDRVLGGL